VRYHCANVAIAAHAGIRTLVARVKTEYPEPLDDMGKKEILRRGLEPLTSRLKVESAAIAPTQQKEDTL
jgi:hypothetical protein